MSGPTYGSLFSGIGGIDLGLDRAGWSAAWQCENDAFCRRVLARHWPGLPRYGDIRTVDWSSVPRVDLIAGGFPCQPVSIAGKRQGRDDERWLWPDFARAVGVLAPAYVLVENVPGLLAGHGGMGSVLGDLAAFGYDSIWDSIPAAAVGAPHLRYRVWIVAWRRALAHSSGVRASADEALLAGGLLAGLRGALLADSPGHGWAGSGGGLDGRDAARPAGAGAQQPPGDGPDDGAPDLADPQGQPIGARLRASGSPALWGGRSGDGRGAVPDGERERLEGERPGGPAPGAADGSGHGGDTAFWAAEPDVGRVADGVPQRVDRLRALGNAVVPQAAEPIGRWIRAHGGWG